MRAHDEDHVGRHRAASRPLLTARDADAKHIGSEHDQAELGGTTAR